MTKVTVNAVWEDNLVFSCKMSGIRFKKWYNRLERARDLPKELTVNGKPFKKGKEQTKIGVFRFLLLNFFGKN